MSTEENKHKRGQNEGRDPFHPKSASLFGPFKGDLKQVQGKNN